jgi:hypothetical protein
MKSFETATAQVIASRSEFIAALHAAVGSAATLRARRMFWVDPDFAEWPLDDVALLAELDRWLRLPKRSLVLLAHDFDGVSRHRARFVAWYRLWSHAVSAFSPVAEERSVLPCMLLVEGGSVVRLSDAVHWRGQVDADPTEVLRRRDQIDALLQRAEPAFASTTLGL